MAHQEGQDLFFILVMAVDGRFGDVHLLRDGSDRQVFTAFLNNELPGRVNDLLLAYGCADALL